MNGRIEDRRRRCWATPARVVVEIRDTGPALPADVLPRIFEPFYTTKEVGKGTGLGLAITYGIIQEHGGQISAANHPDGGAVFTVQLPVEPGGRTAGKIPSREAVLERRGAKGPRKRRPERGEGPPRLINGRDVSDDRRGARVPPGQSADGLSLDQGGKDSRRARGTSVALPQARHRRLARQPAPARRRARAAVAPAAGARAARAPQRPAQNSGRGRRSEHPRSAGQDAGPGGIRCGHGRRRPVGARAAAAVPTIC